MIYSFHPEAEDEFLEAIDYYEDREDGLGLDFASEVYATIDRAALNPTAWPVLEDAVRRCQTTRFPYGILYSQEVEGIIILAVMDLHREPDFWKHRLG